MQVGMLWFYSSKELSLDQAVKQAAHYYEKKYGVVPNRCYTNIAALESEIEILTMKVAPLKCILLNHLWLGVEEKNEKA